MNRQDIIKDQETAKQIVEKILEKDIHSRNNDLWLQLQVWQKAQLIKVFMPYEKMKDMIASETITRVRRTIQNTEGKFLPTDSLVSKRRKVKEETLRNYYGKDSNEYREFQELIYGIR